MITYPSGRLTEDSLERKKFISVAPDMSCSPLGVPADMLSAVKKCPNLFMLWGYVIPSNQAVAGISLG